MKTARPRLPAAPTYAEYAAFNAGVEAMRAASLKALKAHRIELTALIGVVAEMGNTTSALYFITQSNSFYNAAVMIDDLTVTAVGDVP